MPLCESPIPPEILYEDEVLLAVHKPAGLLVHAGGDRGEEPTLEDWVAARLNRPAVLLHRLDRDTSGLVLFSKRAMATKAMAQAFAEHRVRKTYWAVVRGDWKREWNRVETRIGRDEKGKGSNVPLDAPGRRALSTFLVLDRALGKTWLSVLPKTGRTHQIRLHVLAKGCPIWGDRLYGAPQDLNPELPPMALHALRLDFVHPASGAAMRLIAPPPAYWKAFWLQEFSLSLEAALARERGASADSRSVAASVKTD